MRPLDLGTTEAKAFLCLMVLIDVSPAMGKMLNSKEIVDGK